MEGSDQNPVPGLQRERTALAWDRTGVAFLVAGVLFLRATVDAGWAWRLVGAATLVLGGFLVLHGYRRYARPPDPARGGLAAPSLLRVVGLAAIVFSVASAALLLRYA
jgi:uncharacterized membrane protein YidH (DUF202 family)